MLRSVQIAALLFPEGVAIGSGHRPCTNAVSAKTTNGNAKCQSKSSSFFAETVFKARCDTKMFVPLLEEMRTIFLGSFPPIGSGIIALGGESVFSVQKKCCVYSCELYADFLRDAFGAQLLASIEELKRSCQRLYGGAENIRQRKEQCHEQYHIPSLHKLVCALIQDYTGRDARVGLQIWREQSCDPS